MGVSDLLVCEPGAIQLRPCAGCVDDHPAVSGLWHQAALDHSSQSSHHRFDRCHCQFYFYFYFY